MRRFFTVCFIISFGVISWSQKDQNNTGTNNKSAFDLSIPPKPIDPQLVLDQDDMTWNDYHPIPGKNWADTFLVPERKFRMALVAVDFPDQPFVITLPKGSDLFGNPQIDPVKCEDVAKFYSDFLFRTSAVNH